MAEETGLMDGETSGEEGPEFETLACLVEAGALTAEERKGLSSGLARARVVLLAGEDPARVDRVFGALMEEVEAVDGRGPMMVPPVELAEAQLESMWACAGHEGDGQVMAVYDLLPENVAEACRLGGGRGAYTRFQPKML